MKKVIRVTCAIIEKDNRVLIAQRSEQMSMPLRWEFPGGKINNNESEEECITREIKEELSLHIITHRKLPCFKHHYADFTIELIPFICTILSGELDLQEHVLAAWVTKGELLNYNLADADVPIAKFYIYQ